MGPVARIPVDHIINPSGSNVQVLTHGICAKESTFVKSGRNSCGTYAAERIENK